MIGIIDYGAGNIRSVGNALDRLDQRFFVSRDITELQRADKLILPGVGEARSAMESLGEIGLLRWLTTVTVPFLGICIGMQILFEHSEERDTACLGIVPGRITRFDDSKVKVPHMGWNRVAVSTPSPLFSNIRDNDFFYFVHSFVISPDRQENILAETCYGENRFCSVVMKDNVCGCQFHPEKSGKAGLSLLRCFLEL